MIKLIIGLGNPGSGYAKNRHNAGFMAVDAIAADYGFSSFQQKFRGFLAEGEISLRSAASPPGAAQAAALNGPSRRFAPPENTDRVKIKLFKPLTYMNLSGEAAGELARFYQIPAPEILVIHDELDLPLATLRLKQGGGHGGHNGLKSLDAHLGKEYWRLRIGIGHPGHKDLVSDYVLSDFGKEERKAVDGMIEAISDHIDTLVKQDMSAFQENLASFKA